MVSSTTTEWLTQRPKWLQVAAKRLLEAGDLNDAAILEMALLCQQEANNDFPDVDCCISTGAFDAHDSEEIRLCSISEVTGINKLAPRTPLDFGKSNVAVVYGHNGSGKSGYVRLLKQVCGARDCIRGPLHKNVFSPEDTEQKAKVSFLKSSTPAEYEWAGSGVCDDLCSVDIFDTLFGRVFIPNPPPVFYKAFRGWIFHFFWGISPAACVALAITGYRATIRAEFRRTSALHFHSFQNSNKLSSSSPEITYPDGPPSSKAIRSRAPTNTLKQG